MKGKRKIAFWGGPLGPAHNARLKGALSIGPKRFTFSSSYLLLLLLVIDPPRHPSFRH